MFRWLTKMEIISRVCIKESWLLTIHTKKLINRNGDYAIVWSLLALKQREMLQLGIPGMNLNTPWMSILSGRGVHWKIYAFFIQTQLILPHIRHVEVRVADLNFINWFWQHRHSNVGNWFIEQTLSLQGESLWCTIKII